MPFGTRIQLASQRDVGLKCHASATKVARAAGVTPGDAEFECPCTKTATLVALESAMPYGTGRDAERQAGCGEATHSEPVTYSNRRSKGDTFEVMTHQIMRQSNEWCGRRIREILLNGADGTIRCFHHVARARRRMLRQRRKRAQDPCLSTGLLRQRPREEESGHRQEAAETPRLRRAASRPQKNDQGPMGPNRTHSRVMCDVVDAGFPPTHEAPRAALRERNAQASRPLSHATTRALASSRTTEKTRAARSGGEREGRSSGRAGVPAGPRNLFPGERESVPQTSGTSASCPGNGDPTRV